ncbi:MAG: GNAT family N-acetyltransferase [Alphaproteobacteria bacterium]|nr:GNAT family N-acetyltransferase [Alphaproteobacteria bacterium]
MSPTRYPELRTARLILQPLAHADADAIQQVFPRWEIVRYMTSDIPWPYPPGAAAAYLREHALPAISRGEEWHWTIRLKSNPAHLIGMVSLMDLPNENRGFWLAPDFQGRGLMTEAAEAATGYWFDVLGRDLLRAPKAVANEPSRKISQRFGMRVVATEERDFVSGRLPTEIWEITRNEWRTRSG